MSDRRTPYASINAVLVAFVALGVIAVLFTSGTVQIAAITALVVLIAGLGVTIGAQLRGERS
jgi:hypothetical protein